MSQDYNPDALKASYIMVGIDYAAPSPTNPRKTFADAEMAELTASVAKHGVLQPIMVRLWPNSYPSPGPLVTYEIIAGERRWRAAKAAGLPMIEAKLRDLTDIEVLEIQIIENLQRADLHPLEEAEGYERIMGTHAYNVDQLAEKIGKSRSYIFARLKLLALDDDARRLFRAGKLNPSTALLVARIPSAKLRVKAIEDITSPHYGNEVMSVRAAQEHIRRRYMTKLEEAPFPTADCAGCPKRTGNAPDLFEDVNNPDVCTDPDCFVAKKIAHRDAEAEKNKAAGTKVILGDDAKKIAPYGVTSSLRGYTNLNDKCYEDPEFRTYGQIIGETAEATLIEDHYTNTLAPVLPNKVIAEKLQAAGIKLRETERAKADEKVKAKLDLERAIRQRTFDLVRENVAKMVDDDGASMAYYAQEQIFGHIAIRMWERFGSDTRPLVANLWGAVGKNNTERAEAFCLGIPNLNTADCWKLMVDMLLVTSTNVNSEWDLQNGGNLLTSIASLFDIDPAEVKKTIQTEQQAQKPATKAKKSGKTNPQNAEKTAPHPSKAALAAGLDSAQNTPDHTEAAQASDPSAEEDHSSAALAAEDEKPSQPERPFEIGDRVRVLDEPTQIMGVRHRLANQEGVIDGIYIDGRAYPYTVQVGDDQSIFEANQLELIERYAPKSNRPAPQYRHPENKDLEWSGRGRKPKWVEAWLATTGNTLDQLRVDAGQNDSSAPAGANAKPSMAEAAERCSKTLELKLN